jgi:hypothetical protein|eukprot:2408697-Prymnesium_polylepis.4
MSAILEQAAAGKAGKLRVSARDPHLRYEIKVLGEVRVEDKVDDQAADFPVLHCGQPAEHLDVQRASSFTNG